MKNLLIALGASLLFISPSPLAAQNAAAPTATATVSPAPTPIPQPTAIPLADVVTQATTATANLQETQATPSAETSVTVVRDLPAITQEITARLAETTQMLQPGVPLETLRDLAARWEKLADELSASARSLTTRANLIDQQIALLPALRETWTKTGSSAETAGAPLEIRQQVESVLTAISQNETALQKRRSTLLAEQSRVAEQSKRVTEARNEVRAASAAAVSQLFMRDTAPIWSAEMRTDTTHDLMQGSQASFSAQFAQLRLFAAREATQFIYLALIFASLTIFFFWTKRRASKWTDEEPALKHANRVLQLPTATAAVLTLLVCQPLFAEPPRLFWALLGMLVLPPIVLILRRLIEPLFFPIVNALVVFYVLAQIRKLAVSLPGLSRLLLILEMIGGIIFLIWFLRSMRPAKGAPTSHRAARAGARLGLLLFAAVFLADALGYFRLANFLATGALAAAYLAILLYAAAGIMSGLLLFALHVWPLIHLEVVRLQRSLLHRRLTRVIDFVAFVIWLLLALDAFSLRAAVINRLRIIFTTEFGLHSFHLSLGAVLGFGLAIWIAFGVSRLVRFLLEEDIYRRFHFSAGSSYAASTLLHYVILLLGFFAAVAALGVDMTKFTVLAGAFGVGLGFGLQNIVNNFVSGLILLFERPVNVGDVVQVGDATGVIQRIGIRASVIRIADSSELIVPNGQLISEKVTNWTLSNRQRRIDLQVGVAYGSDPKRVLELLTRVAAEHPLATKYPEPQALMMEFGADALNFDVRFWTNDFEQWPQIKSDVAVAINAALREAGIAIPFPQRDFHLQSIDPAVAALLRARLTP